MLNVTIEIEEAQSGKFKAKIRANSREGLTTLAHWPFETEEAARSWALARLARGAIYNVTIDVFYAEGHGVPHVAGIREAAPGPLDPERLREFGILSERSGGSGPQPLDHDRALAYMQSLPPIPIEGVPREPEPSADAGSGPEEIRRR